jgi:hypothetical protein
MYVRFTKLTFDPANYDAMINFRDNTIVPKLNEMRLKGLIRVRMFRASDSEVITLAGYDTKENYEAAVPKTDEMMGGMAQWLTAPPEKWVGELEDLYEA